MTYEELYVKANNLLAKSEITLGEYEEMIKPLGEEVRTWTLFSERLPESEGKYLVTTKRGYVTIASWVGNNEYWNEVTAWMPLPEPYKGGETE